MRELLIIPPPIQKIYLSILNRKLYMFKGNCGVKIKFSNVFT